MISGVWNVFPRFLFGIKRIRERERDRERERERESIANPGKKTNILKQTF